MNNTLLLAGFASFCIMACELDANAALLPIYDQAQAEVAEDEQLDAYDVMISEYTGPTRCSACGCPEPVCDCDFYHAEPVGYDDSGDDDDSWEDDDNDDYQEKLEGIWHRREMEDNTNLGVLSRFSSYL